MGERRLLFLDTTNATSQPDSAKASEPPSSRASSRQSRVRSKELSVKTLRTRSVTRPNKEVWVEVKKTR